MSTDVMAGLPGETLVRAGLADIALGRRTIAACLVSIARTRLARAGLLAAESQAAPLDAELELYALLRREGGDAYARYNALIRELVSFESALDSRLRRAERPRGARDAG